MKKIERYGKVIAMSAAALGMTAALTIESSIAYFTTYVSAAGGGTIEMGTQTEIYEDEVVGLMKHIVVRNTSENDCFVRVKLFYADPVTIDNVDAEVKDEDERKGTWESEPIGQDGYWYWNYSEVLKAGEETASLDVQIKVPKDYQNEADRFNVVVIHECVPAIYNDEGEAKPGSDIWKQTYSSYTAEDAGEGADQ